MRNILLAATAIALAAPAVNAQPAHYPDPRDREIVRSLPSPHEVDDAAHTIGRAAEAVLQVPIGGVVRAIDPRADVYEDETLEDVASRDDPYVRDRIRDSVDDISYGMQDAVARLAVAAPALRRTIEELERSVSRAIGDSRSRRYDRDYADDDYYRRD